MLANISQIIGYNDASQQPVYDGMMGRITPLWLIEKIQQEGAFVSTVTEHDAYSCTSHSTIGRPSLAIRSIVY